MDHKTFELHEDNRREVREVIIPKNVDSFIGKASSLVGEMARVDFWRGMRLAIDANKTTSPIEQLFFVAFLAIIRMSEEKYREVIVLDGGYYKVGYEMECQYNIGQYYADFLISNYSLDYDHIKNKWVQKKVSLIVECDSQQWHERDEKERRYEKKRERYLVSKGYVIYRFTGKEIFENPYKPVCDVIDFLTQNEPGTRYSEVEHLLEL